MTSRTDDRRQKLACPRHEETPLLMSETSQSEPASGTRLLQGPSTSQESPASRSVHKQSETDRALKLDELGPIVVNHDGTLSRIANWATMTEEEKRRTMRVVAARNKTRLAKQDPTVGSGGPDEY
ncbi:hypothetical protein SERLA73DRAFT_143559 [Serpula lacrymans var. lacrymans S7.3]|uniref:Uncharacterized protein n=2 Tax=Serpula lacrymans var. lacrymans TaxID=341189 RepID=F8QAB0_SERL3|nr:uncharacterized protein SERLADRAFT_400309 [Serpula lacrymans var. lacrymans S7.9]EGN94700.1 hypothetical protein SERLA73DRAFT_143559 [Serpula lacrymans var. lacrymans S7.3]EGO20178.1 hypothetical protein SERLADRAFT_400309 [Serpula lacrymans var. lacrymans S7.9]